MDAHSTEDDNYLQEDRGEQSARADATEVLATVDLKIAFGFEKLLNLEMLVMEIARRAADIEPLMRDPQSLSADSVDKAFEFDVLYGIVDSETNELEKLVASVRMDISSAEKQVSEEGPGSGVMYRLHNAADSLTKMQELISAIRRESATFEKAIPPSHDKQGTGKAMGYENDHLSVHTTMQAEDQRNLLQMLQQSIASKLDLEMKLCDSHSVVEDLKMKLRHAEQESDLLEDFIEALYERMFAAENASQFFLGTSKELIGKINTIQFDLSASVCREDDLKSKLEESKLNANQSTREIVPGDSDTNTSQEALQIQALSPPEFLTMRNKVQQLEGWLRDSGFQPQRSLQSREATEQEQSTTQSGTSIISDIKLAISNAESRAQKAEARCTQLAQTNVQLNGELNSLKSQGSDRAGLLETKLKESDTQLEHARASVDAIVEQQGMLRSSMSDMEQMIEDLKEKYLKAETRAENAESKCSLLTDTNLELSEELSFLRGRVENLENSLHQANQLKVSTAKDIGSKTKTISDLVAKLALERERLHVQVLILLSTKIVTLTKKNRVLAEKCKEHDNGATSLSKEFTATALKPVQVMEEASLNSSTAKPKAASTGNNQREEVEADELTPPEDESGAMRTLETVRSIEPLLLNWKHISVAVVVLLATVIAYQLYQSDDRGPQGGVWQSNASFGPNVYHANFLASTDAAAAAGNAMTLSHERTLFFAEFWEAPSPEDVRSKPSFCCPISDYGVSVGRCSLCEKEANKIIHPPSGGHSGVSDGINDLYFCAAGGVGLEDLLDSDFIYFDPDRDVELAKAINDYSHCGYERNDMPMMTTQRVKPSFAWEWSGDNPFGPLLEIHEALFEK
nr:unnamed protein product [Digitaria exilis]